MLNYYHIAFYSFIQVNCIIRRILTLKYNSVTLSDVCNFNLFTSNVNYSGRTAPLTSKVAFYIFIQQI